MEEENSSNIRDAPKSPEEKSTEHHEKKTLSSPSRSTTERFESAKQEDGLQAKEKRKASLKNKTPQKARKGTSSEERKKEWQKLGRTGCHQREKGALWRGV